MDKYLELLLVNLGLPGALIAVVVYVIKSGNRIREKELESREKVAEANSANNKELVDSIKSMAYEFGEANKINAELSTKSDIHSKNHIDSIDRIEAQIIAIHGRCNTIGEKETENNMLLKDIKNTVDKCYK